MSILDNTEKCPLCNGVLEAGEPGEDSYPDIVHKARKMGIFLRIVFSVWIILTTVCGIINYYTYAGLPWAVIVSLIGFYIWFMLYLMAYTRVGYLGRIFGSVFVGVVLVVYADITMGFSGWSIDYVLPGGLLLIDLALIIIRIVNRKNWQSYMYVQLLVVLMGIVPVFFVQIGLVKHPALSIAAFYTSVLLFITTLIIGGRAARSELRRRFHI